jgi:hypothetical protein
MFTEISLQYNPLYPKLINPGKFIKFSKGVSENSMLIGSS